MAAPDEVNIQYYDSDGKECTLVQICKREPEWAASRIENQKKQIEDLRYLIADIKKQMEDLRYLIADMECDCMPFADKYPENKCSRCRALGV